MLTITCKFLHENAQPPRWGKPDDLALDLTAVEDGFVAPGGRVEIRTGISLEASPACGFLVKERSGHARRGLFCLGGVIDPGYRGEVVVLLANIGFREYSWKAGDRIAQIIPILHAPATACVADKLSESVRGESGFGSTGR
jgi:dUTP pyrophosphatase